MPARRNVLARIRPAGSSNAALWLDKFLEEQTGDSDEGVGKKGDLIQQIAVFETPSGYKMAFGLRKNDFEERTRGSRLLAGDASTDGRLVVGLGDKGVMEVGITLDHTWGVPYLPGSALKGLAAAAAHKLAKEDAWRKPARKNGVPVDREATPYDVLFGTTDDRGAIIFHDAWWDPSDGKWPLHPDVVTVHHPDYYQKADRPETPSDFDSPTPISFASVHGRFLVALEASTHCPEPVSPWLDAAVQLLKQGLAELGIGAKTSSGYGRMSLHVATAAERERERAARTAERLRTYVQRISALAPGNADQQVPALLSELQGTEDLASLAMKIIERLTPKWLKSRKEKTWVRELFDAAGKPLG